MRIEWRRRRFEAFIIAALVIGLWFVMSPVFERGRKIQRGESCQSNLKQTGLAMMIYKRDHDEKHPLANRWSGDLFLYSKSDQFFHCPSVVKFGYSMNTHLDGLNMNLVDQPRTTPLVFDSSILKKSQHDGGASWPKAARHPQGNAVLFDDGHVSLQIQKPPFRSFAPLPKPKPEEKPRKNLGQRP